MVTGNVMMLLQQVELGKQLLAGPRWLLPVVQESKPRKESVQFKARPGCIA